MARTLIRPVLIGLFVYLFTLGATFNGVFIVDFASITLMVMALALSVWLLAHWRGRWFWHRTPLDTAMLIWGGAILLSLVTNAGDWRRIVIGIWYATVYVIVYYVLADMLANRVLQKVTIVDAVLVAGALLLVGGYAQLLNALAAPQAYSSFFGLPRPVSLIGNPNAFGSALVVLLAFSGGRLLYRRGLWRWILVVYFLLSLMLLFLTYSRGAWLGGAAAIAALGVLWLGTRGLLSPDKLRTAFNQLNTQLKLLVSAGIIVVLASGLIGTLLLVRSFGETGRSADLRTYIWDTALAMFGERPLTGHGLFTFGKGLQIYNSTPPTTPHNHAHNIILHTMAELGLPGLLAVIVSLGLIVWAARRNWQAKADVGVLVAGIAGAVGMGVHLLFDTTIMMPILAITGMLILLILTIQADSQRITTVPRRFAQAGIIIALGVGVVASGWWSNRIYAEYVRVIKQHISTGDYLPAARELQPVIEADPAMLAYQWQQGMLYGMAAYVNQDLEAARAGAEVFQAYLDQDSFNAIVWVNLGALRWQLGEQAAALTAFEQASNYAPESWQLALIWGYHAELAGDTDRALIAYNRAIEIEPDVVLHPLVRESQIAGKKAVLSDLGAVIALYLDGDVTGAAALWDNEPIRTVPGYVMRSVLALESENQSAAAEYLAQAEARLYVDDELGNIWFELGQLRWLDQDLTGLRDRLLPVGFIDIPSAIQGSSLWRNHFLREVLPGQYLPQVAYTPNDVLLWAVLNKLTFGL